MTTYLSRQAAYWISETSGHQAVSPYRSDYGHFICGRRSINRPPGGSAVSGKPYKETKTNSRATEIDNYLYRDE